MSEANRALAIRWMQEIWNERRADVLDELMHVAGVGHMATGDVAGPAEFKLLHSSFLEAIPDLRITVEDSVAEGDSVVLRWRVTGTHLGAGLGMSPTGRAVDSFGLSWFRFSGGQLAEGWDGWNFGGLTEFLRSS